MDRTLIPAGHDPRRSFMVHGASYRRQIHRKPEAAASLWQVLAAGIALAVFVVGGLVLMAGVS